MRKKIIQPTLYEGHEKEFMFGALSSLAGSGIWLLVATALRLPVSGTHSIVGATIGFSLVCRGTEGVSIFHYAIQKITADAISFQFQFLSR